MKAAVIRIENPTGNQALPNLNVSPTIDDQIVISSWETLMKIIRQWPGQAVTGQQFSLLTDR